MRRWQADLCAWTLTLLLPAAPACADMVDVDQHAAVAQKYGVRAYPTLMLFDRGKVKATLVGVKTAGTLRIVFERVGA